MMSWFGANWKTSLVGIFGLITTAANFIPQLQPVVMYVIPALIGVLGLTAKDANVTGGTVPQTREAEARSVGIAAMPVETPLK
jgi:hypothetical protein